PRAVREVVAQPGQEDEDEAQADEREDCWALPAPGRPATGLLGAGVYRDSGILKSTEGGRPVPSLRVVRFRRGELAGSLLPRGVDERRIRRGRLDRHEVVVAG